MAVKRGYKQSEVGFIPDDWYSEALGNHATFKTGPFGSLLHRSDYVDSGIPIVNPMQIIDGTLVPTQSMTISEAAAKRLSMFRLSSGDVVIGRRGDMGRCAYVRPENDGWLCGTGSMIICCRSSLNSRYLQRVLSSPQIIAAIERASVGTTMINLNNSTLRKLQIPLPPTLHEQEAIAGALSDADAWIESLEQLIAKKRQIKQGSMQELLTGKRRLPGFSGTWETKRLGELGSFYSGGTPNTSIPEYYGGDIAWITSSDCNAGCVRSVAGRLTSAGVANSATKWVVPGTVLMALYGATAGVVAISKIDATINQAVLAMKLDSQDSSFMFQKLSMMKDWIIQTYTQGGQPNLSGAIVKSIDLELPAYDEQVAIATVLSNMDTEIESLESKLAKAREVKQGMMQELLTGKIRLVKSSAVSANPLELSDDR